MNASMKFLSIGGLSLLVGTVLGSSSPDGMYSQTHLTSQV